MLTYKVVETSTVTDEELERIINQWVAQKWNFEGIHFIIRCSLFDILRFKKTDKDKTKRNHNENSGHRRGRVYRQQTD